MTDINQSFSLMVGDDIEVDYDIGPDDDSAINLDLVQSITWTAYLQAFGVPDITNPIIVKGIGSGVQVTDPLLMKFSVTLAGSDTVGLSGNYYYDIKIIADRGAQTTPTTGLMTVIDPAIMPNVNAFKSSYPAFANTPDWAVQQALNATAPFVDDSWGDAQVPAMMLLAAHFLTLATSASGGGATGQVITSESLGRVTVSYAQATSSATAGATMGTLMQTVYGIMFANMLTAQGYGIAIC